MKNRSMLMLIVLLFSFTALHPASELAPEDIHSTSFVKLGKQLPKGWETARGLLFVTNSISNNVTVFSVGDNGSLTPVAESPFLTGGYTDPEDLYPPSPILSHDGKYLFVANTISNNITVFSVRDNGSLTPVAGSPFDTGGRDPSFLTLSNNSKYLFVTNEESADVAVFSVASNGFLTPVAGSPFGTGGRRPVSATLSHDDKHLFVTDVFEGAITVFSVRDNGSLTRVDGSPFDTEGVHSISATPSHDGKYLFVLNRESADITVFSVASKGVLQPIDGSPFDTEVVHSIAATFSHDGKYLFVANQEAPAKITVFSVACNGVLKPIDGSPFDIGGSDPISVTFSHDGKYLFVDNEVSNNVTVFSVSDNGSLTPVAGSPFDTGGRGLSFSTLSHDGQYLFVANRRSNNVTVFSVGDDGLLTPVTGSPFHAGGAYPRSVLFTPLPKKWRERQAIALTISLDTLQKEISLETRLPEDIEELIARMVLGKDVTLTGEMKFHAYLYKHGFKSLGLKRLQKYLALNFYKQGDPSPFGFLVPTDGTLTKDGFQFLNEWAKDKSPRELKNDLESIQEKLEELNLNKVDRDTFDAMYKFLNYLRLKKENTKRPTKKRRY